MLFLHMDSNHTISRRTQLGVIASVGVSSVSGCLSVLGGGSGVDSPTTEYNCELMPRESVSSLPQPTIGPDDATVTVDVYEDYSCPHCRDFHTGPFQQLKEAFSGGGAVEQDGQNEDLTVQFRHFDAAIPVNEWSRPLANAGRYIQHQQSDDMFYRFVEQVYQNQSEIGWQVVGDIADENLDVDPCGAISAGVNGRYEQVIESDRNKAFEELDIPGTPSVYVNGERVDKPTFKAIETAVREIKPE